MALQQSESGEYWFDPDPEVRTTDGRPFQIPTELMQGIDPFQFSGLLSRHVKRDADEKPLIDLDSFLKQLQGIQRLAEEQRDALYRNNFYQRFAALHRFYFLNENLEIVNMLKEQGFLEDPTTDPILGFLKDWEGKWDKLDRFKDEYPELWKRIFDLLDVMFPVNNKNVKSSEDLYPPGEKSKEKYSELKTLMAETDEALTAVGIDTTSFEK